MLLTCLILLLNLFSFEYKMMKLCHQISFLAVLTFLFSTSGAARSSSSKHGISYGSSGLSISYPGGKICNFKACWLVWQYGLWSFQTQYIKLERFLHNNQHTQRKFLNYENWTNREPQLLAKIKVFKVDYFILPLFLVPKLWSFAQNEWKKHPYIFFFTFGS